MLTQDVPGQAGRSTVLYLSRSAGRRRGEGGRAESAARTMQDQSVQSLVRDLETMQAMISELQNEKQVCVDVVLCCVLCVVLGVVACGGLRCTCARAVVVVGVLYVWCLLRRRRRRCLAIPAAIAVWRSDLPCDRRSTCTRRSAACAR